MNLGAKVLEVLDWRCRDWVRIWPGIELSDVLGEKDCCRSCLEEVAGVGEAKSKDLDNDEGDMGEATDMSEL